MPSANSSHYAPVVRDEALLPPHNISAEEAVLGSLFIDPDAWVEVADILEPQHFYKTENRWIYGAMEVLIRNKTPLDLLTVSDELRRQEKLANVGSEGYLVGLASAVPTSINIRTYAEIVVETSLRRQLIGAAGAIANLGYNEEKPIEDVLSMAEKAVFAVRKTQTTSNISPPEEHARDFLEHLEALNLSEQEYAGVPTGLKDLDDMLSGLQKGQLYFLAGRPGMGKSVVGLQIALHVALSGRVYVWSGEMGTRQINTRLTAQLTGIENKYLYDPASLKKLNPADWKRIYQANDTIGQSGLLIDTTPSITGDMLRSKCLRAHWEGELDLIVIDHIHLMASSMHLDKPTYAIGHNSSQVRQLAKELDVPVLCLAQLSRGVENRADKRPMMSDLRDSGSLEQDAFGIIFAYRDEYYNPDMTDRPNVLELNVSKLREGRTGTVDFFFDGARSAVRPLVKHAIEL